MPYCRMMNMSDRVSKIRHKPTFSVLLTSFFIAIVGCGGGGSSLNSANQYKLIKTITAHETSARSTMFSPDEKILASCGWDGSLKLWDTTTWQLKRKLQASADYLQQLAFSPDGLLIATASNDKKIHIWDVQNETLKFSCQGHTKEVLSVTFSPNGQTIASGATDGTIRLWDRNTGQVNKVVTTPDEWVISLAYSPDGTKLISTGFNNSNLASAYRIWNASTGVLLSSHAIGTNSASNVTFLLNQSVVALGAHFSIRLLNLDSMSQVGFFDGHSGNIDYLQFSKDGKTLFSCAHDATLKIWNVDTGELKETLIGHTNAVRFLSVSSTENLIASSGDDQTIRIWKK